jgi:VanZ family protein
VQCTDTLLIRGILTMSGPKKFIYYHLPAILYAGLIITISSLQRLPTDQIGFVGADKVAHFFEYALFAFLTFRSFSNIGQRVSLRLALLLSLFFLVIFAAVDEYYQHLVGRSADFWDLVADVFGACLVLLLLWLRERSRSRLEAP